MEVLNEQIRKKAWEFTDNKIVMYISIALSFIPAHIVSHAVNTNRFMQILIFCLIFGLSKLILYIVTFAIAFAVMYIPKAVTWKGIIHRLEFFTVLITAGTISRFGVFLCSPERFKLSFDFAPPIKIIGVLLIFFMFYISICATIKRLNDLRWSKWLAIIGAIPYVGILINVPCMFLKSKQETDNSTLEEISQNSNNIDEETSNTEKTAPIRTNIRNILIPIISVAIVLVLIALTIPFLISDKDSDKPSKTTQFSTSFNMRNAYWIPINENWSFDINSIKQNGNYASIASKTTVSRKSESGKFIKYVCYVDIFKKDTLEHKTALTIALDENLKEIETRKFPFGHDVMLYPEGSMLETLKDIAFLPKKKRQDILEVVKMGMVEYFSPYIVVGSPDDISPEEKREKEEMIRRMVEEYEKQKKD